MKKLSNEQLLTDDVILSIMKECTQAKVTGNGNFIDEGRHAKMRQGVLTVDSQSGRMDIRFGLEEYYGGLHCGTSMEVLIDGKWVPARQ